MDNTLRMSMLFDFFGELLTEKQREYFDLYHNEDLSLSEIAKNAGISRQGVHDIITRAEHTLVELEHNTGVVQHFSELQAQIVRAQSLAETLRRFIPEGEGSAVCEKLISALQNMKGS